MAIRLYLSRDTTGDAYSITQDTAVLSGVWNDKVLSVQIDEGESWLLWTDSNYQGTSASLSAGSHDAWALARSGMVSDSLGGRVSSLQRRTQWPQPARGITLYKGQNGDGPSITFTDTTKDLPGDWNDAALSCAVMGGSWVVYEDHQLGGSAAALGAGLAGFQDLRRVNMAHSDAKGRISSLQPLRNCPAAYWMAKLRDDCLLSDLTIPGTHDSGTYSFGITPTSKCQSMGIREQLLAGVRYLDIRCKLIGTKGDAHAKFAIYHGKETAWLDFQSVLDDCAGFLAASPGESIVLSIKNDSPDAGNTQWFLDVLSRYMQIDPGLWYWRTDLPLLGDVRGKLVLFRQFDLPAGVTPERWGLPVNDGWGGADGKHRDYFVIDNTSWFLLGQDAYDDLGHKWERVQHLLDLAASNTPGSGRVSLFVNYTSAVQLAGIPKVAADSINPKLKDYLAGVSPTARLGIIPMDFPSTDTIARLISQNDRLAVPLLKRFPDQLSLQAARGLYVCADRTLNKVVVNRSQAASWETFSVEVVDAEKGQIALRTSDNHYLCAEGGGGSSLVADRTARGVWETFTVRRVSGPADGQGGVITLQAADGSYVSAEGGGGAGLVATAPWGLPWERFTVVTATCPAVLLPGKVALQATSGEFLCAESGGGAGVLANRVQARSWETFTVVVVNAASGKIGLRAANGQYVCAEGGGESLIVNRGVLGPWETFTVLRIDQAHIALQACNGRYLRAVNGGGGAVIPAAPQAGRHETLLVRSMES